jgi:O-antigen ligase
MSSVGRKTRQLLTGEALSTALNAAMLIAAAAVGGGLVIWPALAPAVFFLLLGFGFVLLYVGKPWMGLALIFLVKASLDNLSQRYAVTGSLNANGLMNVLIILGGAGYLILFRLSSIRALSRIPAVRWFTLFLVLCLVSLTYSRFREAGIRDWVRLASAFMLFVLMIDGFRERETHFTSYVLSAMLLGSLVPIGIAAFQAVTGSGYSITVGYNRVFGTFWHPNGLAFFVSQVALYALAGVLYSHSRPRRMIYAAVAGMAILILVMTFTRIAWIAFLIGAFALSSMRGFRLAVALPIALAISLALVVPIRERFSDLTSLSLRNMSTVSPIPGYSVSALFNNSLHFRIYVWSSTAPLFMRSPILGNGWGSFNDLAAEAALIGEGAHNDYWRLLVETGLMGLVVYLGLVISVMKTALRLRRARLPGFQVIIHGFIAGFLSYLISQMTDNLFEYQTVMWYIWGMAGLVVAQAGKLPVAKPDTDEVEDDLGRGLHVQSGQPAG